MDTYLKILGDGQVWDVKGISPLAPGRTFEDLFSGRALAQMAAEEKGLFFRFRERGKLTGRSVTKAFLSNNPKAKKRAQALLENLARNGAFGISALAKGKGIKKGWSARQRGYWKNLDAVIIGGGVSRGKTGRILVNLLKEYLSREGLAALKVYQARFPGKEAGFLGAVINIIRVSRNYAEAKRAKATGCIGLDLGREEIGVGLLAVNPKSGRVLKQKQGYWFFSASMRMPYKRHLKKFLDTRKNYTAVERQLGRKIRAAILGSLAGLVLKAQSAAGRLGIACSRNIGVAVPGSVSSGGYILNSTDYLPFFRKQDGFNFAKGLEKALAESVKKGIKIRLINDGIAAGIANIYFSKKAAGKVAFLGVGSGLGGCVALARRVR
ncbi:MAG: hypothetical protein WC321_06885 [Candidatus Omnitrophota bacterium]|jgi:predicted NBD/HSP70 family sugar kinase